jgi:hypothetical protein
MVPLERLSGAGDAVAVVSGLRCIYDAISVIKRGRGEVPMFWTHVMLLGGMGGVMVIISL